MIALSRDELIALQLACECLIRDTTRKQKLARKRRDYAALERLTALGDAVGSARRKVIQMAVPS